jgi:hypothetical protein
MHRFLMNNTSGGSSSSKAWSVSRLQSCCTEGSSGSIASGNWCDKVTSRMSYARSNVSAFVGGGVRDEDLRTESLDSALSRVLGRVSFDSLPEAAGGEPLRLIGGDSVEGEEEGVINLELDRGEDALLSGGNHFDLFVWVIGILTRTWMRCDIGLVRGIGCEVGMLLKVRRRGAINLKTKKVSTGTKP